MTVACPCSTAEPVLRCRWVGAAPYGRIRGGARPCQGGLRRAELPIQLPIQGTGFDGARGDATTRDSELSRPNTTGRGQTHILDRFPKPRAKVRILPGAPLPGAPRLRTNGA